MVSCRINGEQYLVDFEKGEFYSVSTSKTFVFSDSAKITNIKNYLAKYDA